MLTVVDRFSKYAHFIPLGHPYSAATVARAFFDGIVRLHDIPCSIISDHDTVFTGTFWKDLFRLAGVQLNMSSAFHPRVMASRSWLTASSPCTYGALLVTTLVPGCNGCHGPSIVTILRSRRPLNVTRSGSSTVAIHPLCSRTTPERPRWQLSTGS